MVKVAFSEKGLRQQVKEAGGIWSPNKQSWQLRYDRAKALGLKERIVENALLEIETDVTTYRNPQVAICRQKEKGMGLSRHDLGDA